MTGAALSIAGLAVLGAAGLALQLVARSGRRRPAAGQALAAAMRSTPGRAAVLLAWVWLGVHFLAR